MSSFSGVQPDESRPQAESVRGILAPVKLAEIELFRRAQAGDRGAFGEIVLLYQDRLYNAILRMVNDFDDARDLTQECFTRALEKIDSFRGEAQPYTWLFRIALNLSIGEHRKTSRRRTFNESDGFAKSTSNDGGAWDQASSLLDRVKQQDRAGETNPARAAEDRERDAQVIAALDRLDPEYRAILVMRDVEGFDYQQMATVLDLPLGTLKSRLFRARVALKDELSEYMK